MWAYETPLRELATGSCCPIGALFVVATFSYSDGKLPLGGLPKSEPVAAAQRFQRPTALRP